MMALESPNPVHSDSPQVLADLRLYQRKAFELCALVLGALRTCEANAYEDALKAGVETARNIADTELRTQNDDVPIANFLAAALAKVIRSIRERAESFPLSDAGKQAVDLLTSLRTSLTNDTGISCRMIANFAECHSAAHKFYSDYLARPHPLPQIGLRIVYTDEPNKNFPGREIAFNGGVRYEDEPDAKRSIVRLNVYPKLNIGCLPALSYIVMHEILCHWPQMSRLQGNRPNPRESVNPSDKRSIRYEVDPFSEGWMDSLVAEVLMRHSDAADAVSAEEMRTAQDMHNERTLNNRSPAFVDAARIAPGAEAARLVRWFYCVDDDPENDPRTADPDFRFLSCELNLAAWGYDDRRGGCIALIGACRAYDQSRKKGKELSPRQAAILNALRVFRKDHNPDPLLTTLLAD
jgi:hypothetical protein